MKEKDQCKWIKKDSGTNKDNQETEGNNKTKTSNWYPEFWVELALKIKGENGEKRNREEDDLIEIENMME